MRSIENSRVLSRRWLFHIIPRSRGLPKKGKSALDSEKIISICRWYVAIRADTDSGGCSYETVSMASAGTVIPERGGEDKGVEKFRLEINAIAFSVQLRGDL